MVLLIRAETCQPRGGGGCLHYHIILLTYVIQNNNVSQSLDANLITTTVNYVLLKQAACSLTDKNISFAQWH